MTTLNFVDMTDLPRGIDVKDLYDPDHLMEITRELYERESRGLHSLAVRIGDLLVTRESSANDWLDAEGLIQQSASLYQCIDGIQAVAKLGVEPLRTTSSWLDIPETDPASGETVTTRVHLERLEVGKAKAVLFTYRGTSYLYSLASAATLDAMGQQDWTRLLIRQLVRLRPRRLRAVSVSRYTRNLEVAGLLLHAMSVHTEKVFAGSLELEMKGTRAAMDKLLFVMLAMAAALERDALVSRMLAGKVNAARNNRWMGGDRRVPPGYRMTQSKKLIPVPEDRELVQEILRLIAERPTPTEFVKRLGRLGVKLRPVAGADGVRSVGVTGSPNTKRAQYMALVPLWVTGKKLVKLPNPFPGAEELGGIPVVRGLEGREEVHIVCDFGVPDGGWAEKELLDAAYAAALEWSEGGAVAVTDSVLAGEEHREVHERILSQMEHRARAPKQKAPEALPWCGSTWGVGQFEWSLHGRGHSYQLLRTLVHDWIDSVDAQAAMSQTVDETVTVDGHGDGS